MNRYFKAQPVGTSDEWVRNPDWLPMPELDGTEEVFYALYAVFELGGNYLQFRAVTSGGLQVVDFGDGTSGTFNSGNIFTKEYEYNDIDPSTETIDEITGLKYRQVLIKITTTSSFDGFMIFREGDKMMNYLDIYIHAPNLTSFTNNSATTPWLERFRMYEWPVMPLNSVFVNATRMTETNIDWTKPTNFGSATYTNFKNFGDIDAINCVGNNTLFTFTRTMSNLKIGNVNYYGTNNAPFGTLNGINRIGKVYAPNVTSLMFLEWHNLEGTLEVEAPLLVNGTFFARDCSRVNKIILDAPNIENLNNFALACWAVSEIIFTDASNVNTINNNAFGNGTRNLRRLRLPGIKVSLYLIYVSIDVPEMVDLFNDLADLVALGLPSQNINITLSTASQKGLSQAQRDIALNKGWTITG